MTLNKLNEILLNEFQTEDSLWNDVHGSLRDLEDEMSGMNGWAERALQDLRNSNNDRLSKPAEDLLTELDPRFTDDDYYEFESEHSSIYNEITATLKKILKVRKEDREYANRTYEEKSKQFLKDFNRMARSEQEYWAGEFMKWLEEKGKTSNFYNSMS